MDFYTQFFLVNSCVVTSFDLEAMKKMLKLPINRNKIKRLKVMFKGALTLNTSIYRLHRKT